MTDRVLGLFILLVGAGAAPAPVPQTIDFNRDVRPILSENCYACHGPDKNKRKDDLRLDTKDGIFSAHETRHTVVPGKLEESELYRRITAADPTERMPDPKSNKRLTDRQIAVIKKWIEQGADWKGHWAWTKPVKAQPPAADDSSFVKTPIDQFVLAKLKEAGLKPAPEADRVTLIRRLYFDLIGLPPSPEDVRQFVNDQSPDAYDKLVDRLLSNPHYGERMAVSWLDLVRYADSIGYHSDNSMNVWPFRDYVIKSFNENKHFDQFTIGQLAGDLLPDATVEQKVASAYNRLLQTTEEGGAQPKEYEAKYLADRVRNVSSTWLGATMGCCQCHDHKFDPFTQKDFYSLGAFFADVQEASVGRREPGMPIPSPEQAAELKKLDEQAEALKKKLDEQTPQLAEAQAKWEKSQAEPIAWTVLAPDDWHVSGESKLRKQDDGSLRDYYKVAAKESYTITAHSDLKGVTGFRLEALPDDEFPAHGPGTAPNGNFVLSALKVETVAEGRSEPVKLVAASADHSQDGYPVASAIESGKGKGWAILPQLGKGHEAVFETDKPIDAGSFRFTLEFHSQYPQHNIGKVRLSVTTAANPAGRSVPEEVKAALAVAPDQRNDQQKMQIAAYFRGIAPELQPLREELEKVHKQREDFVKTVPTCLVSVSGPPRTVRLKHRGNWQDETGDIESPAAPAFLPQPDVHKDRLTRLDLAQWLVSRENPLTARVFVNRLWKLYFGQGISKSLEDFGSQGEWPTNPELLDWLAVEFMDSGWDVKHMVRLMVTSGAYRESSIPSPQDNQVDPFDRLMAHQSRFRLDAEFVRDNALAISGLLAPKLGGPSVKPYQPAGYWDALNFPTRTYEADHGQSQYRRGLYTWWQRSFLHPSLQAFDAPSREEGVCERLRSNIPQQALVLLNDPTYVEAARVFAVRIVKEGGATVSDRMAWAYETALSRKPNDAEKQVLVELYAKHLKEYTQDADAAKKLLNTGDAPPPKDLDPSDLAAWTSVARVILNLSETITRS